MTISLDDVSKRYGQSWIVSRLTATLAAPQSIAILGANGAGKSTLLRLLAGLQKPTKGTITYKQLNGTAIAPEQIFQHISYCAPGMDMLDELTPQEFLDFHFSFKRKLAGMSVSGILHETGLAAHAQRYIGDFSSGMKQRIKLAQAIFSDSRILLLDEPCTNLDDAGVAQYNEWIVRFADNRLIIIASNDPREYAFCKDYLQLSI